MDASTQELTRTINKLGEAFEAFKDTNDERIKALEKGDTAKAAELNDKLGKIEIDVSRFSKLKTTIETAQNNLKERIEELEAKENRPGKTSVDKIQDEYKATFTQWIRKKGKSIQLTDKLEDLEKKWWEAKALEAKAVTIGTPAAGGVAVPEEISREIERQERLISPVRSLVRVVTAGSENYKQLVNVRGSTGGWVGETDARPETATSQFRERTPTFGSVYAYPHASEESLNDIFFDVPSWITEETAETFAIEEGIAVISGNGTKKPTGMLNTAPVDTADTIPPTRSANAFQYLPVTTSPTTIDGDTLIDLTYLLNSRYKGDATWIMNSSTAGTIRKLKGAVNQDYLWQPGLTQGQPDRLLGYPLSIWEDMENIGADNFPVGFGNWRRAYLLVDLVGLRITVDDNITTPGYVKWYLRRRVGGCVLNNNAAKFIKTS
jgi:HK97 family phage major capsid protein